MSCFPIGLQLQIYEKISRIKRKRDKFLKKRSKSLFVQQKAVPLHHQIIVELKNNGMNNIESSTGEIVMYQPDETIRLEVRMGEETVWLSQAQMAELFGTKRQAITKHLQNIYESDELKKEATSSILELVRKEGNRTVKRKVEFYNLDAIISIGFRVNTKRGIEFRQWANRVLKD